MERVRRAIGVAVFGLLLSACGGGGGDGGSGGGTQLPPATPTYSVTTSVTGSGGGSISPTSATVSQGGTTSFTISAASGSTIAGVSGCGGSLSGSTYTTGAISSNCTVTVTFDLTAYTVTATAGSGGSISPESVSVSQGGTASFTVTPSAGYQINSVSGCGGSLSGSTYTTGPITAACSVTAAFSQSVTTPPPVTYTVSTTTTGAGSGTISPTSASVNDGQTATFTVTAAQGSEIESVSGCVGSLSGTTYTTGPITANCNIVASFRETSLPPTSSLTLTGHVVGAGVPDVDVLARVGSEEFHSRTDADGHFTVSISIDDPDAMVALYASTPQRPLVDLFSVLGTVTQLTLDAGPEGVLTADSNHSVNITVFTTARAVLAERALGRPMSSDEDIDMAISSMWPGELVELAAVAWLVLEKNAPLPFGVTGIRQLLNDQDAIEEFKTWSVTPEELEEARLAVVDPVQEPRMLPRFTAEQIPEGYVQLSPTKPGTLSMLVRALPLKSFASDGTGFRYYPDPERQYAFDWLNTATGQLRIVPRGAAIEQLRGGRCWDGSAWQEYTFQWEVIERNYQLLYRGRRADQLYQMTRWRQSLVGELPIGCDVDLPLVLNGVSGFLAAKIGDGEIAFTAADFPSTRVLMDVGRLIEAEPYSSAVGLFYLEPGGTGIRLRWEPGEPLDSDTTPVLWSLENGRVIVSVAGEEVATYFRLTEDGRGGEGLAYIVETGDGPIGGYAYSATFSPEAKLSSRLEFFGEWKGSSYLSALPEANRSPFNIRLCNDQAPTEENTGPLYGTGTMTNHGPLSWDMRPENGELLIRIYYDQATQTFLPFCEKATPPEAGSCRLYQQREWLPVARDGNRLYVIERLEIRRSVVYPQSSDYLGIRTNFYENFGCAP